MVKSILLAVDGSTYTDAQVKYCTRLAKAFGSQVHVLTVVDVRFFEWAVSMGTEGFVPVIPSSVYQEETKRVLESKADAVLKKCAAILAKERVPFKSEKLHGPPADLICEQAYLADLVLIGVRGEFARWKSKIGGATLEVVVRQCDKPTLITPETYREIRRLLVAYDGSKKANKALQMAAYFAANLSAPLAVLTVHDADQLRQKYLQEAQTYLEAYAVETELIGIGGSPEKNIVNMAEERGMDLIVMGAFGHNRIREAILGSTTEYVMRNTNVPVLLCK